MSCLVEKFPCEQQCVRTLERNDRDDRGGVESTELCMRWRRAEVRACTLTGCMVVPPLGDSPAMNGSSVPGAAQHIASAKYEQSTNAVARISLRVAAKDTVAMMRETEPWTLLLNWPDGHAECGKRRCTVCTTLTEST
jgi:hypothetical protein